MSVAFDAIGSPGSSAATVGSGSSLTWNHTCSGSNRLLIVGITVGENSGADTASVTYNGVAMASAGLQLSDNQGGFAQLFYLIAPPSGSSYQIAVSISGPSTDIVGNSLSFTGADQVTGVNNVVTNYGSGVTGSISVSSAVGNMVVDVFCSGSGLGSGTSDQTLEWHDDFSSGTGASCGAQSIANGSSSVTMGYANFNSDWWGLVGANILAVATPIAWIT